VETCRSVAKIAAQGFTRAACAVTLALGLMTVAGAAGQCKTGSADKAQEARTLADDIVKAYGGTERLHEIDTLVFRAKGTIKEYSSMSKAENSFDCTMVSRGNKLKVEMTVMGQPLVTAYDGKQGWLQQGDQVFPADPATLERLEGEIKHSLEHELLALTDRSTSVSTGKAKEVNGKMCDLLVVRAAGEQSITLYADKASHLVLRSEFIGVDTEQGIPANVANEYGDYRQVFGTEEPFLIVEFTNGQKTTEAAQDSAQLDNSVTDAFFEMPQEPHIARLTGGSVEIPFEYMYNQIMIKMRINDNHEANFIVDSGASQSMLDQTFADSVGATQKGNYSITTGGGSMHMNYMIAKKVQLGELSLDNIAFGVTEGAAFTQLRESKPAGIIGANILKRFLITVDYANRKIILSDPHDVHVPENAAVIATKPAMGNLGIVIEGTLDHSLKIPFLVDTGAAFNNVSASLVKPLVNERLLSVSKILGLDGQQIDVGAVRFDSLRLGSQLIEKPVFSVAVRPPGSSGAGIITSNSLAILGNPLWCKFKLTLDYRHNRIFLEQSPRLQIIDEVSQQLSAIRTRLHKDRNNEQAIASCKRLLDSETGKDPAAAALLHAEIGALLIEQAKAKTDKDLVFEAKKEFDASQTAATESKDQDVQARVYAALARHIADMDPALVTSAKSLIGRAIRLAPMDPEVLTAAAIVLKGSNNQLIEKVADQALSADPANWDALWFRYKLSQELGEKTEQSLVGAQLKRYYADSPEVLALEVKPASPPKLPDNGRSVAPASTKKKTGKVKHAAVGITTSQQRNANAK
jgi:hypothetical protein